MNYLLQKPRLFLIGGLCLLTTIWLFATQAVPSTQANPTDFNPGDLFAGVGGGMIKRFAPDGTLLQTLDTTSFSSEETGMCFDTGNNLYATNFSSGDMTKFDVTGAVLTYPWAGPFNASPESCVVDAAGNIYTGQVNGAALIQKWDVDGNFLDSYSPAVEDRGIDWIDLASDQCTMYYTSEGTSVKRYDVCTDSQLADFATGLTRPCFALRIRSNGEVMVACSGEVYRLDVSGNSVQTYDPGDGSEFLFALNLDPDGETFWTGGYFTGNVYRMDIETGTEVTTFNAGIVGSSMAGLGLFGELTAASPADLAITKIDTPDPVDVGSNLAYNISVTNNGPSAATGVVLTDTLPAEVTFVSANASQGTCVEAGGVVTCAIGNLSNGSTATVTIDVTPTSEGSLTNIATVSGNEDDDNLANNSAMATTTVESPTDVSITSFGSGSNKGWLVWAGIICLGILFFSLALRRHQHQS